MARAGAAVVLALAVCCLLVAPAPARRPADREAAAEPLRPKPAVAADCADAAEAEQGSALAVPEQEDPARDEEPRRRSSSLLCLVFRCGGEPAGLNGASEEPQVLDDGTWRAVEGKAEAEDEDERPYETDWDSDCDSDDEGEEDGVLGWLWRLADRFWFLIDPSQP
ncbi:hypothetical protein SETIT_5G019200v2 [Setaria italica]|uniref:Uncharacterized protein n=1 Tax=Setaria italica TaxID=4555 RepID=A0A368R0D2_SETIT|nr:hypothetical protein SETIT_5G019200v2 [Setaria italica]